MRLSSRIAGYALLVLALALPAAAPLTAGAQSIEERLAAVVRLRTTVPADARTAEGLGREREGSAIVIDQSGLVLTIGYLMVEAQGAELQLAGGRTVPAQVVGYDHDSGFGLLRALEPLRVKPVQLGKSATLAARDPVLIAAFGGAEGAQPGFVVARRVFAGGWEYLLDDAIFTAPPHPAWSGAALFDKDGRLVGVGSLIVGDASGHGMQMPGNMFVPIDRLPPILADLIADGAPSGPRKPWLGMTTEEMRGRLFVTRVAPEGPAAKAGIRPGDIVLGVGGQPAGDLADLYRKVWATGGAGTLVPLNVLQGVAPREIEVRSVDRLSHLKLKRSF
jgi:S1-C subfamily serine protease